MSSSRAYEARRPLRLARDNGPRVAGRQHAHPYRQDPIAGWNEGSLQVAQHPAEQTKLTSRRVTIETSMGSS